MKILGILVIIILCIVAVGFFVKGAHKAVEKDKKEEESDT